MASKSPEASLITTIELQPNSGYNLFTVTKSFFKATTPDDRVAVEVFECGDAFRCTVTLDGTTVLEELQTEDQDKLLQWAQRQMTEAMRRCARPQPRGG